MGSLIAMDVLARVVGVARVDSRDGVRALAASEVVVNDAAPPMTGLTVASTVVPSLNTTVPVGVPAPGNGTAIVAVKVIDWPTTAGLTLEMRFVCVASWPTVRLPAPVLVRSLELPE